MIYLGAFIIILLFVVSVFFLHLQVNAFEKKINELIKAIEDHIYI